MMDMFSLSVFERIPVKVYQKNILPLRTNLYYFSHLYLPGPPPVVLLLLLGEPVPSLPQLLAQFAEGEARLLSLKLGPLLLGEERERGKLA